MRQHNTRATLTLARHRAALRKSDSAAPKKIAINLNRKPNPLGLKEAPKLPNQVAAGGDYVRVMRPGLHQEPVLARTVASGKHGITAIDNTGRQIKVRHEHVVERYAVPAPSERGTFASALAAQGVPVSLDERFLKLDASGQARRRPSLDQLALLEVLSTQYGVPIDMERTQNDASFDDAQALLARYVSDPEGRIVPADPDPQI